VSTVPVRGRRANHVSYRRLRCGSFATLHAAAIGGMDEFSDATETAISARQARV